MRGLKALTMVILLGAPVAASAAPVAYKTLDPAAFQSFVGNWTPDAAPLCAAIGSQAQWDTVMHPAATMGGAPAFGPPAAIWGSHAVLLIARVMPGGGKRSAFTPLAVEQSGDGLDVSYRFASPPAAPYDVKRYMALEVAKPLPARVTFTQNGKTICSLQPGAGDWLSPEAAGR